jgi:hypothetical protein
VPKARAAVDDNQAIPMQGGVFAAHAPIKACTFKRHRTAGRART